MRRTYPLKRLLDIVLSIAILTLASPILLAALLAVWLQDFHSPFFSASRVGRGGADFRMLKVRSMRVDAAKAGVNSTGAHDSRITVVGRIIRKWKIDELSQFLNVLTGSMSIVGPRPQVRSWGTDLYTEAEKRLLTVKPGITDLSSIIFSDEGQILEGSAHPDLTYNQLIRPWKSRLGLFYIDNSSLRMDLRIIYLTIVAVFHREKAIAGVVAILKDRGASPELASVCERTATLAPAAPPGAAGIEMGPQARKTSEL